MKPLIIAGPCVAESLELLDETASFLHNLSLKLNFDPVFKSSFDKANRTSGKSYRGPGWPQAQKWFETIKSKYHMPILTDIHETIHVKAVAETCEYLQIPAFLCRQTDLVLEAVSTGRKVNIKKGQFMAPETMQEIVNKAAEICGPGELKNRILLTERGATFGYGNLVVDMRAFQIMSKTNVPLIFDITHSLQIPPSRHSDGKTSGGNREFAPVLARAAAATGYLSGFFLEIHSNPDAALSDKATQLTFTQAESLLGQILPVLHSSCELAKTDSKLFI